MHSETAKGIVQGAFFFVCPVILSVFLALPAVLIAQTKDRVVAYVDNTAITLSELEKRFENTVNVTPNITRDEVLNTMVNRVLLLREAAKIRLGAPSEEDMLKEYVDLKIKAFIRIREEDIEAYYARHMSSFEGKELDDVREDIENYLVESELNQRLKAHISELRQDSCIKVQLHQEDDQKKVSGGAE